MARLGTVVGNDISFSFETYDDCIRMLYLVPTEVCPYFVNSFMEIILDVE